MFPSEDFEANFVENIGLGLRDSNGKQTPMIAVDLWQAASEPFPRGSAGCGQ